MDPSARRGLVTVRVYHASRTNVVLYVFWLCLLRRTRILLYGAATPPHQFKCTGNDLPSRPSWRAIRPVTNGKFVQQAVSLVASVNNMP